MGLTPRSYEEYVPAYVRDGYVIVRGFLPPAELNELRATLERYIREVVPTLPDADAFYEDRLRPETLKQMNHLRSEPALAAYATHPRLLALGQAVAGEEVVLDDVQWFNKPAGTAATTPPHQDNYYANWTPCNFGTLWIALEKVDEENACLRYISGSHLTGYRPHSRSNTLGFSQGISDFGPADLAREVQIHLDPGDVVVHHGMTIHRAEANRSPTRGRPAFAVTFKGISCRRDEEARARYSNALKAQHETLGLKAT